MNINIYHLRELESFQNQRKTNELLFRRKHVNPKSFEVDER